MPTGLDIDYKKPLQGTMPRYTQHVAIRTQQDDWSSRIENKGIGKKNVNLARELKELVGPKGKYHDPYRSILITNISLEHLPGGLVGRDVSLFPQGHTVTRVGETPERLEAFVKQFLMSRDSKLSEEGRTEAYGVHREDNPLPTILICGHGLRDTRCGVMGPLLREEFEAYNRRNSGDIETRERRVGRNSRSARVIRRYAKSGQSPFAHVGLCSHIGGHAWAGNVIVYIPPGHLLEDGTLSPLAGKGVWYGRVEPKHVEGIIEETVWGGRVIEELLRGVHDGEDMG